jgi:hypothetical protein
MWSKSGADRVSVSVCDGVCRVPCSVQVDAGRVKDILEEYIAWFNHIKFQKGWAQLTFGVEDVRDHLETAAHIVVFIRAVVDAIAPGFKLRQVWLSPRPPAPLSPPSCTFASVFMCGLV